VLTLWTLAIASAALAHPRTAPASAVVAAAAPAEETLQWRSASDVESATTAEIWVAVAIVALVCIRRFRTVLAIATVAALLVLTCESGVHSVHHLGDPDGASQCLVASATTHLAGVPTAPPSFDVVSVLSFDRLSVSAQAITASQSFRPDAGRAPPA
jgi:hypothetical protein